MVDQRTHEETSGSGAAQDEFAVDIESDYVPPLKDPHLLAVTTGETAIRRRASDFNRSRPANLAADIELKPVGTTVKVEPIDERDVSDAIGPQTVVVDVENASVTKGIQVLPSTTVSQAPSMRDDGSTVHLTNSQTRRQRRLARVHFAVMCFNFFLNGWNDASTGPLLPTIQRAHNVCASLLYRHEILKFDITSDWFRDSLPAIRVQFRGKLNTTMMRQTQSGILPDPQSGIYWWRICKCLSR